MDIDAICVRVGIERLSNDSRSLSDWCEGNEATEIDRFTESALYERRVPSLQVAKAWHLLAAAPILCALLEILVPACKQRSVSKTWTTEVT